MTAFILLYCYLFVVWIITLNIRKPTQRRFVQSFASFLGLLFLLGFHSPDLGCDVVGSYIPAFERTGKHFITSADYSIFGFELGYMNYMVLMHHISDNVQFFLFTTALIILIPIVYLIYRYSENIMFSVIIYTSWYLYYFSFSALRQSIAISICAIATLFLFKRKIIPFVLVVFGASTFHTSALLFLIAYPLYVYRLSNKKLMTLGIIGIAILILFKNSMQLVATLFFGSNSRYVESLQSSEFAGFTIAIVYFVFAMYQMYLDKQSKNPYLPYLFLLTIIQTTGIYSQTIPRLAYYFIPLFAISFPLAINSLHKTKRFNVQTFLIIIFVSFFMMQANGHYFDVTPFKFFWE